jgi:8-oxo-dGTP pyrophosphatase MutT (NUDIX family)
MTDPKTPSAPSTSNPEGIPAATVVIFRNNAAGGPPEILMQIRSRTMTFAGGMAVFPGGRVDEADFALADTLAPQSDDERGDIANRIAAIRETLEETGLVIGVSNKVDAETAKAAREHLLEVKTLAGVLAAFEWSLDLAQLTPFARWFPKNEPIMIRGFIWRTWALARSILRRIWARRPSFSGPVHKGRLMPLTRARSK